MQGLLGPQVFTFGPKIDFINKNRYINWYSIHNQVTFSKEDE